MRIVQVLGTSGGGVVRHVADLAEGLAAVGDDVRVVAPQSSLDTLRGLVDAWQDARLPVQVLDVCDRPRPRDVAAIVRLRRLVAGSDVVHAHGVRAGALAALALVGRRSPRVVVTVHNAPPEGRGSTAVYSALERIVARRADEVLVVSADLGARMLQAGARKVARALVPAPTRTTGEAGGESPAWRDGAGLLVATAARLAPQKALHLLLDAVAEVAGAREGAFRVVIAGEGPLLQALRDDVTRRSLPVVLPGRVDDVPTLFEAADVVALTSRWEGQPLVLQEALRAGAAIVATDVGGVREVCGDAAVLVPWRAADGDRGPVEAFAAALDGLLRDKCLRAELSSSARTAAERLPDRGAAVAQVRDVYARLVPGTPRD